MNFAYAALRTCGSVPSFHSKVTPGPVAHLLRRVNVGGFAIDHGWTAERMVRTSMFSVVRSARVAPATYEGLRGLVTLAVFWPAPRTLAVLFILLVGLLMPRGAEAAMIRAGAATAN